MQILYELLSLFKLLAAASIIEFGCAVTECSTLGEGFCEPLNASHWCEDGTGVGCSIRNDYQATPTENSLDCLRTFTCQQSYDESVSSVPVNVTVTTSPNNQFGLVDFHIQWDDSENDGSVMGYEVLIGKVKEYPRSCGCTNVNKKYVTLRGVNVIVKDMIQVKITTLPYTLATQYDQTAFVNLTLSNNSFDNVCLALATNEHHCSQPHSTLSYSGLDPSNVAIKSRYIDNSTEQMMVEFSWAGISSPGLGVVITITDPTDSSLEGTSCTMPGRNPPCFMVTQAIGATIQPLNSSINYTVNFHRFNMSICSDFNPTHLFDGCGNSDCCNKNTIISSPATSADAITEPTTMQIPPTSSHVLSQNIPEPTTMQISPTSSHVLSQNIPLTAQTNHVTLQSTHVTAIPAKQTDYLVSVVSVIVISVIAVTITILSILIFLLRHRIIHSSSESNTSIPIRKSFKYNSTGQSVIPDLSHNSAYPLLNSTPSPLPINELKSLYLPECQSSDCILSRPILYSYGQSEHPTCDSSPSHSQRPTDSSTYDPSPPCLHRPTDSSMCNTSLPRSSAKSVSYKHSYSSSFVPSCSSLSSSPASLDPWNKQRSVLIIYSPSINDEEREFILKYLVGGLSQYGLSTHCHDTECVKNPCQWMEHEIEKATAVLCVCNKDFQREWEGIPSNGGIPVVNFLKHLIHGTVSCGKSLAKFATVLLEHGDKDCIPSLYLQGEPRSFLVTEVEEIAKFVQNIPSYATVT